MTKLWYINKKLNLARMASRVLRSFVVYSAVRDRTLLYCIPGTQSQQLQLGVESNCRECSPKLDYRGHVLERVDRTLVPKGKNTYHENGEFNTCRVACLKVQGIQSHGIMESFDWLEGRMKKAVPR